MKRVQILTTNLFSETLALNLAPVTIDIKWTAIITGDVLTAPRVCVNYSEGLPWRFQETIYKELSAIFSSGISTKEKGIFSNCYQAPEVANAACDCIRLD